MSFQQLQATRHIVSKDFFKYLRIRSALSKVKWSEKLTLWHIIKFFNQNSPHRCGISYIYKLITYPCHTSNTQTMLKWEQMLQCSYTPQQWYRSLQTPFKVSKCLLQCLFKSYITTGTSHQLKSPASTHLLPTYVGETVETRKPHYIFGGFAQPSSCFGLCSLFLLTNPCIPHTSNCTTGFGHEYMAPTLPQSSPTYS